MAAGLSIPEDAERLFSQVFHGLTQRHVEVITFRQLASLGQQAAITKLSADNYRFALSLLSDPQYDEFFKDRRRAVEFLGGPTAIGSRITDQQVELFNAAVDAASLIFIHSAVDAALSDLCRVAYLIDPLRWRPFVEAQKISLSAVASSSSEDLWKEKLEGYLKALEKESVKKRTERLFAICKPDATFDPMRNFAYDTDRLERLDRLRQNVVHGCGPSTISNCEAELEYLVKVGVYFFTMVHRAFGVKVNPFAALGIQVPIKKET